MSKNDSSNALLISVAGCEHVCEIEARRISSEVLPITHSAFLAQGIRDDSHFVFARQILVDPEEVLGESVRVFVEAMHNAAGRSEEGSRLLIHVFASFGSEKKDAGSRRCKVIKEELIERLRRKSYGLFKRIDERLQDDDTNLLQLCLLEPQRGYVSILPASRLAAYKNQLSRFEGGRVAIPPDRKPPSRAYRKLLEAESRFGFSIRKSERVVDLGASPGGWSYVALHRGADVTAIDRSPLRDDLMRHRGLSFRTGDGFKFEPDHQVDWMLCDVAAFPERTLELLRRWCEEKWTKKFCITFKFRGDKDLALLDKVKSLLVTQCRRYLLTALDANKNEVTAVGELSDAK